MKPLFAILLALTIHATVYAEPAPMVFVVVTKETKWQDGLTSAVGEVEIVLATDAQNYHVWSDNGKRYPLPKTNAQVITAEDAALRVIQFRQELYKEIDQLNQELTALQPAPKRPQSSTDRYYQRKADRDARAKDSVDSYYQWKMRNFLDRQ